MKTSPYSLIDEGTYQRWRDQKLKGYPTSLAQLVVEIRDPRALTDCEHAALLSRCRKTNMAVYASTTGTDRDQQIPLAMARQFGLKRINKNWLSDDSGLTSLTVREDGVRSSYVPYTNRAINWHTDGYYNSSDKQIHALILHVTQQAARGGENALMDPEIAYILLRDKDPEYIHALMDPRAMTIPARIGDGGAIARPEAAGPIFSVMPTGDLHMRYTIRASNVIWNDDPLTRQALNYLETILRSDSPYIYRGRLDAGMGLISNNVLHDRAAFADDADHKRHYYRARYYDRLTGTNINDRYSP